MNWTRIAIVVLGSGWFFLVSCTAGLLVGTHIVSRVDARDASAGETLHSKFSVVRESREPGEPFYVMSLSDVSRFAEPTDSYRMFRPSGELETDDSHYSYEVIETTAAGQIIEVVEAYKDGDNTIWSRYEAAGSSITPISSRMFYFGYAFVAMPYAIGVAFILYFAGRILAYRNTDPTDAAAQKKRRSAYGLMIFVAIYGVGLVVMYFVTTPTETDDFTGPIARNFTIAGIVTGEVTDDRPYRVLNLERLNAGELDLSDITFLLPQPTITINVGDIHRAEILEDHGEWQLVAFHYSNTRTSTAVYRAYVDRIEPVSYRLTSSAGHLFYAVLLLIPTAFLTWIITAILRRRSNKS